MTDILVMIWCRRKTCTMNFISIKIGNMIVPYLQWWIDVWMIEGKNNGWINCYHKYFSAFCTKWYLSANASPWCTSKCMIRTNTVSSQMLNLEPAFHSISINWSLFNPIWSFIVFWYCPYYWIGNADHRNRNIVLDVYYWNLCRWIEQ